MRKYTCFINEGVDTIVTSALVIKEVIHSNAQVVHAYFLYLVYISDVCLVIYLVVF